MNKRLFTILLGLMCLAPSCKLDLVDINTSAASSAKESEMRIDIRVSGEMVDGRASVSDPELQIDDFDLFVFSVTAEGNYLEYVSMGNLPELDFPVEGTKDKMIWSQTVIVPSTGTKRIVAVGNSSKVMYPDMTLGFTTYEDFCKAFHFNAMAGKEISFPLVMTGSTLLASSDKSHAFVRLARQYNRFEVEALDASLVVKKVQILNTPSSAYPFFDIYDTGTVPPFINYPVTDFGKPSYILYTPGADPDFMVNVKVSGEIGGVAFDKIFECASPLYPDYNSRMQLSMKDGDIEASFTPNYDSFQTSGAAMTYTYASWMWTGLYSSNDYAQAWVAGNPVTSQEGATFKAIDIDNPEYPLPVSYSTGTTGQLKNRLRAHSMYNGDYFIWTVPVPEAKKGGSISMLNAMVSATQWGPKYFMMEYSWDGVEWLPAKNVMSEKSASGSERIVTYNVKLSKNDTPESLDYKIEIDKTIKDAVLYTRLTVSDACCSKEANGDIDATKTVGITYVHVKNYDTADKDRVFDDDWAIISFVYEEPKK